MKTQQEYQLYYWGPHYDMVKEYNAKHGTNIQPWECVKLIGHSGEWANTYKCNPLFDSKAGIFHFALTILFDDKRKEHRPVFVGDRLWNGQHWIIVEDPLCLLDISWNPLTPKRTFKLNDLELPCPEKRDEGGFLTTICGEPFLFDTWKDCDDFKTKLKALLTAARDKE